MFDYELVDVNSQTDFLKLDLINHNNYCLIFFHYDKTKITEDYDFVKNIELNFKYHVNWIDITTLMDDYKALNKKINLNPLFKENFNEEIVILGYIKEYIFDQLIRTGKYYKI